jgi:hypothetical protein
MIGNIIFNKCIYLMTLFWENRRKISQIIYDDICLSIYLLFILRPFPLPPPTASLAFSHLSIKVSWLLLIFEKRKELERGLQYYLPFLTETGG